MSETNGVGHNHELTDEQQQALFFSHLGHVRRQKEKLASATADLRNLYKKAKADGFAKKELDFALALEADEDNAILEQRRRESMIARWMEHPVGMQSDLFAEPQPDRAPLAEKSFAAGKRAGMEGETCKPPEGSAEPQDWIRGWHAGQDLLKSALPLTAAGMAAAADEPKLVSAEDAGKKRRGRPPGSGKKVAPSEAGAEVQARSDAELAEPDEVMDQTYAERLRAQNDAVDAQLRGGAGGEPAAAAFAG